MTGTGSIDNRIQSDNAHDYHKFVHKSDRANKVNDYIFFLQPRQILDIWGGNLTLYSLYLILT